jgi:hypothetical protein
MTQSPETRPLFDVQNPIAVEHCKHIIETFREVIEDIDTYMKERGITPKA